MIKLHFKKQISPKFNINIDCEIPKNQFVCIYGQSGCGKTTLLNIMAGFLKADNGYMIQGNKIYFDNKIFLPPQKRNIGFVFQDYALFPNMNVLQNLIFANNDKRFAFELLEFFEIIDLKYDKIQNLSGGQKQRVALARALMKKPEILLLDEPLSALDSKVKIKLQNYLQNIQKKLNITTIMVSHDLSEVYKLSNIVCGMNNGRIDKIAAPYEFFEQNLYSNNSTIPGKIVKIIDKNEIFVVIVSVSNLLYEVILSKNEAMGFRVDDDVAIKNDSFGVNIVKG